MGRDDALQDFYATYLNALSGLPGNRLKTALQRVKREDFLGPGPWAVPTGGGSSIEISAGHPELVYQDILIAIDADKGINNGEPSLHARFLGAVAPKAGEAVVHVGSGSGYYSAILAELVGPSGTVEAFEVDPDLADIAAGNLAVRDNVKVHARSAADGPIPESDVIYINAGVTRPLDIWLDALKPAGRMVVPMTPDRGLGVTFLISRQDRGFSVKFVWRSAFIPCIGARDEAEADSLVQALRDVRLFQVRSLMRSESPPDHSSWYAWGTGWLSTRDI